MSATAGFDGQVILVAGGATGIGAETAQLLASRGARVAVGDLSVEGADRVVEDIGRNGGDAIAIGYDQADEESIVALVRTTAEHFGSLAGVVGNAADLSNETLGRDRQVLRIDAAVWARTLLVNLTGAALIVRECVPHLLSSGGGSIVLTSSDAAVLGEPSRPAYAASKAGINALIRHVASRWGRDGIRANAVSPGLVMTEVARATSTEAFITDTLARQRSARLGEPADVAATIAFLLSSEAEWINGQVWSVNGGLVLH